MTKIDFSHGRYSHYTRWGDNAPCLFCDDVASLVMANLDGGNSRGACVMHLKELYASELTLMDFHDGRYDASEA